MASISRVSIEAARAEYKRRLTEEPDSERDLMGDVVVARGVTLKDYREVPPEWLEGIILALLPEGALVVERLTCSDSDTKAHEPFIQSTNDCETQTLTTKQANPVNYGTFDGRTRPGQ